MNSERNDLQNCLLEMMTWLHSFCVEHQIRYYAIGGTMLGAVRHHGFIPWDDDLDIGMPRPDYERFLALTRGKSFQEENYRVESARDGALDYYYPYAKIYDTRTTLIENRRKDVKRGVFIDVFPIDGIGNSKAEMKERYRTIQHQLNILASITCGIRKGRSFYKNAAVILMKPLPDTLLNIPGKLKKLDETCSRCSFDDSVYAGNLLGNWRIRESMKKEYYGRPKLYQFESIQIYGVENPEKYLNHMYGNWKELPSENKRMTHHDYSFLDLEKSYLSY